MGIVGLSMGLSTKEDSIVFYPTVFGPFNNPACLDLESHVRPCICAFMSCLSYLSFLSSFFFPLISIATISYA